MEMAHPPADRLLLLGTFQVIRDGAPLTSPARAKSGRSLPILRWRQRPVIREKLCELFWDVADDPRSELRWCLSKLRPLVDGPTTRRLIADRKQVSIDITSLDIDAISAARDKQKALARGLPRELRSLLAFVPRGLSRRLSRSTGLRPSRTGSLANGTAFVNCTNSYLRDSSPSYRWKAMNASKYCGNASKSRRWMKQFTLSSFALCFGARSMRRPSARSMHH